MAGLVIALIVAAVLKVREGFHVRGKLHLFFLFLLLESPWLIYVGVMAGMLFGLAWIHDPAKGWDDPLILPVIGGGALLGVVLSLLRQMRRKIEAPGVLPGDGGRRRGRPAVLVRPVRGTGQQHPI